MKVNLKPVLLLMYTLISIGVYAQEKGIVKGSMAIETGIGTGTLLPGLSYFKSDQEKIFGVGAQLGYFLLDNLAVKTGLGYSKSVMSVDFPMDITGSPSAFDLESSYFMYNVGVKYYALGQIPVQINYTGRKTKENTSSQLDRNAVDLYAGYAWFVTPKFSLEPAVGYSISTTDKLLSGFGAHVGLNFFLR